MRSGGRKDLLSEQPADKPDYALVGVVRVPQSQPSPARAITRRIGYALTALMFAVFIVYLDRDGYIDAQDNELSFLDCVYYATVSLSTTGYGDVTPITPQARLVNVLLITPLRIFFLIVLVGTTISALTETSRQVFRIQQWRRRVRDHTVVVGYGTKGRAAVDAMLGEDIDPSEIVVVDTDRIAVDAATARGLVTVRGSATKSDVLRLATAHHATAIIVATNRDDTAVLVTLTARQLAPAARIVAAIDESDNMHQLRQSGADSVVISSETAGRLLGVANTAPAIVEMIEDLLTPEAGFVVGQRGAEPAEVGRSPRELPDIVLGIVREGRLLRAGSTEADSIDSGDEILYVRLTER